MAAIKSANALKGSAIASLDDAAIRLPAISVQSHGDGQMILLDGVWTTHTVGKVDKQLSMFKPSGVAVTIDCANVTMMDTAGAWMVRRLQHRLEGAGARVDVRHMALKHKTLFDAVSVAAQLDEAPAKKIGANFIHVAFEQLGKLTIAFWTDFLMAMNILGAAVGGAQMKAGHRDQFTFAPVVAQIYKMGVGAIPIIVLMSFIMGAIIAQQGAFQLRYFGAEIFVVDLVGILVLREIGVILTAIMVAGRSGSAITAEIGSMKMREEIDALKVIGLNPIGVLIFPRLVALVISLPLLTFIANMAALLGAMLVAQVYSGISSDAFITRVNEAVDLTSFFAGIIKAPFMAIIIGVLASVEGLKVGGSAESLGLRVTASVVKAIFVVIVVDGLFAMFFAAIDF